MIEVDFIARPLTGDPQYVTQCNAIYKTDIVKSRVLCKFYLTKWVDERGSNKYKESLSVDTEIPEGAILLDNQYLNRQ